MGDREDFYARRDRRSVEYGATAQHLEQPIGVVIGEDAAETRAGQVLTLALVNMLSRVHREIHLSIPRRALAARSLVGGGDLEDAVLRTALAIDPFCRTRVGAARSAHVLTVGVGARVPGGLTCHLGAAQSRAMLAASPLPVTDHVGTLLGAGMAACLGAATMFQLVHGMSPTKQQIISVWDLSEGETATVGPLDVGPVDVGGVLVVGAGAVASGLAYWLREIGHVSPWTIIDGDELKLHNTNRGLTFLPADADWPCGPGAAKAQLLGTLLGCRYGVAWYDAWVGEHDVRPDLVLALANDRGVRQALAALGLPLILHATTSRTWQAQLHRHIAGRDDCLACRTADTTVPLFGCSSAPVSQPDATSSDAALPFLSAAAGIMLAASLLRLQAGELERDQNNFWTTHFRTDWRATQRNRWSCRDGCSTTLASAIRKELNVGTRWDALDGAVL